jgi:hypothetical protein
MYRCFPANISDDWLVDSLNGGKIPNMYPDFNFLNEHYEILEKYKDSVTHYKGAGYIMVNSFLQTGIGDKKTRKTVRDLFKLYNLVKPLPYDIVVYRGVTYTIGQDFMTGTCARTRKYKKPKNFDDKVCPKMIPIKVINNLRMKDDIRNYIYENLGFVSTTTDIFTALHFSNEDTIISYIIKAGTRFICPLNERYKDDEYELILFPLHNSFILTNMVDVKMFKKERTIYVGIVSDKLNKYRLPNHPKLHDKIETNLQVVEKCIVEFQKPRYKCTQSKIASCAKEGKYCREGECSYDIITECKNIDKFFWYHNNHIDYKELKQLKPYGACTARKLLYSYSGKWVNYLCDPKDGKIVKSDKRALARLQKEVDHQKATGMIIDFDYPNMDIETLKTQTKIRGLKDNKNKDIMIDQLLLNDELYEIEVRYLPSPKYTKATEWTISHISDYLMEFYKKFIESNNKNLKKVYKELFNIYLENNKWFIKEKEFEKISKLNSKLFISYDT